MTANPLPVSPNPRPRDSSDEVATPAAPVLGGRSGEGASPLTQAPEWSTFYASFDELVQDNISRSTALLRKALDLPAAAGREVAQVRADLEQRLRDEREVHRLALDAEQDQFREVISEIKVAIDFSRAEVGELARHIAATLENLHRLGQRCDAVIERLGEQPEQLESGAAPGAGSPKPPASPPLASDDLENREVERWLAERGPLAAGKSERRLAAASE